MSRRRSAVRRFGPAFVVAAAIVVGAAASCIAVSGAEAGKGGVVFQGMTDGHVGLVYDAAGKPVKDASGNWVTTMLPPSCANTQPDSGSTSAEGTVHLGGEGGNILVAADMAGTVLVADGRVRKLDVGASPPQLATIAGQKGTSPGVDFVRGADGVTRSVGISDGADPLAVRLHVTGMAIDPLGRFAYLANTGSDAGLQILQLPLDTTSGPARLHVLANDPLDLDANRNPIAVDIAGNVYVAQKAVAGSGTTQPRPGRILVVNATTNAQSTIAVDPSVVKGGLGDIAVDAAGVGVYVVGGNGQVLRYNHDGTGAPPADLGLRLPVIQGSPGLGRIAVDAMGKTLIVGSMSNGDGKLSEVDLSKVGTNELPKPFNFDSVGASSLTVQTPDPSSGKPTIYYAADINDCSIKRMESFIAPVPPTTQAPASSSTVPDDKTKTTVTAPPPQHVADPPPQAVKAADPTPVLRAPEAPAAPTADPSSVSASPPAPTPTPVDGGAAAHVPVASGGANQSAATPVLNAGASQPPPPALNLTPTPAPTPVAHPAGVAPPAPLGPPTPSPGGAPAVQPGAAGPLPPAQGGSTGPSPGLSAAPGQPFQPATRYAMVRHDGGVNAVPVGLFGLGGCMLLVALGVGFKSRRRGGGDAATSPAPARAWGTGP